MMFHMDFPPLGTLRIASPEDASRISVVATAAFRYSPLFDWERPNHENYPEDTIASYQAQFLHQIYSDDHIVLVQEDAYMRDENFKTAAIIPDNTGWTAPKAGDQVIVAVISIKLEPGSPYTAKMKSNKGSYVTIPHNLGRDLNRRRYDDWSTISAAVRKKNNVCKHSVVSMMVVHPAYWRRGHGTRLAAWARDLSVKTKVPQCVSAAPMSQCLFMSLGYKQLDVIAAEGDDDDTRGVKTLLLEFGREDRGGLYEHRLLRRIIVFLKDTFLRAAELIKYTLGRVHTQGSDKGAW